MILFHYDTKTDHIKTTKWAPCLDIPGGSGKGLDQCLLQCGNHTCSAVFHLVHILDYLVYLCLVLSLALWESESTMLSLHSQFFSNQIFFILVWDEGTLSIWAHLNEYTVCLKGNQHACTYLPTTTLTYPLLTKNKKANIAKNKEGKPDQKKIWWPDCRDQSLVWNSKAVTVWSSL